MNPRDKTNAIATSILAAGLCVSVIAFFIFHIFFLFIIFVPSLIYYLLVKPRDVNEGHR